MVRDVEIDGGDVSVTIALTVAGCPLRVELPGPGRRARRRASRRRARPARLRRDEPRGEGGAHGQAARRRRGALEGDLGRPLDARARGRERQGRRRQVVADGEPRGRVRARSATRPASSTPTSTATRSRTCSGSRSGRSLVDQMIVPPVKHDLKLMSIGFFLDDNSPVMWRGPMLHRALEQFLSDVHWGELDLLLVDMPPGTGDVSISLGQLLPRAEAVIVTTPQPLAQEVASRAATMAQKTNMRLIGVIENMTSEVFGTGGGERLAEQIGAPLLGCVPLDVRAARVRRRGHAARRRGPEPRRPRGRSSRSPRRSTPAGRRSRRCRSSPDRARRPAPRPSASPRPTRRTLADALRRRGAARQDEPRPRAHRLAGDAARARPRRAAAAHLRPSSAGTGTAPLGYLTLAAICDEQLADPPATARVVVASRCFPTGALGYWARRLAGRRPRRRADGDPPAAARLAGRRAAARRDEPDRDRRPELGRASARRRRLDGARHARRRPRRARPRPEELVPFGGDRAHKAFALAVGLRRSSARSRATSPERCCSSRGPSTTRCPRCASSPAASASR